MNIEIHKLELVRRFTARIQAGQFHDADELIEKALDALDEHTAEASPTTKTGAVALAAMQASPYPDLEKKPRSIVDALAMPGLADIEFDVPRLSLSELSGAVPSTLVGVPLKYGSTGRTHGRGPETRA